MKWSIAVLPIALVLVGVSELYAQEKDEKELASKYLKDALVYRELAKAPEKARARRNPLEGDPNSIPGGRNLFEQHCAECHGNTAEGGRKGPSLRAEEVQKAAPGAIFWILTNGVVRRGMPVCSKLPEPQRWQLVSFIKSMGPVPADHALADTAKTRPVAATESASPPR